MSSDSLHADKAYLKYVQCVYDFFHEDFPQLLWSFPSLIYKLNPEMWDG